jgi:hypothetical protein
VSQPCSAVELLLFDLQDLADPLMRDILALAVAYDLRRGGLGPAGSAEQVGADAQLAFWVTGEPDADAFARVTALTGIDPGRTVFVSTRGAARRRAEAAGLQSSPPDLDDIERLLF